MHQAAPRLASVSDLTIDRSRLVVFGRFDVGHGRRHTPTQIGEYDEKCRAVTVKSLQLFFGLRPIIVRVGVIVVWFACGIGDALTVGFMGGLVAVRRRKRSTRDGGNE